MNLPRKINFVLILFLCDDFVFRARGKGYNPAEACTYSIQSGSSSRELSASVVVIFTGSP